MKFREETLLKTLMRMEEGWTTYQVRKFAGVSVRRVNQVWKQYQETGKVPKVGAKMGRPARCITKKELRIVKEAYEKYRVSASTLERLIERDYAVCIPHNHIRKVLVKLKYARPKSKKDKRKKDWIRYERRHSLTAVHIDWYYDPVKEQWVFGVIDDASRKILSRQLIGATTGDRALCAQHRVACSSFGLRPLASDKGC